MPELELSQLHFLRPWWLLVLMPVLYVAWRYLRARHARSQWEANVDPALLAVLLDQDHAAGNRWFGPALLGGLTLAVVALAGPSWERLPQPLEQRSDGLVVVLDLSLSMLANDVSPSRVERARYKIADVLRSRTEGHTGLVVFAGDAHVVTPLTDDVATIENLLPHLSPGIMPLSGSDAANGVALARRLFDNAGFTQGRILLITAGVRDSGAVVRHATRSFPISVLGVGTRHGAPIPLDTVGQAGQTLRDRQGQAVFARLDADALHDLARRSHGRFTELTTGDADIRTLLDTRLPLPAESARIDRHHDTWVDRGYLLAVLLLPLALFGFRRGAVLCLCLVAVLPVQQAHAGAWEGLWHRADQQGHAALHEGDPERAARLFNSPGWTGIALYRSGDYAAAEQWFAGDLSARGHYNRGNAIAQQGRLEEAIAAYDEALALAPEHADAEYNRALLMEMLEDQQQQADGDDADAQDPAGADDGQEQDGQGPNGESGQDGQPGGSGEPGLDEELAALLDQLQRDQRGDLGADADAALSQLEEQQALEQWLRRVPDDPGGLLRRKFQQETNRRLREGELQRRPELGR